MVLAVCGHCHQPTVDDVCMNKKCSSKMPKMAPGGGSVDAVCVAGHKFDAHRGSCPVCTGLGEKGVSDVKG